MGPLPIISVIVPVYNAEKYLRRCIDSILAQTYTDFELLLIDDGSTDASGRICDEYAQKDSRIRVFHKENGGASSARNVGLDNIRGKWVTFCDADDYVYEHWLDNFNIQNNVNYDFICQGIILDNGIDEIVNVSHEKKYYNSESIINLIGYLNNQNTLGYTVIKLFKRSLIDIPGNKLRFNVDYDFMEDEDFICRYLQRVKTAICVDKSGYHYFLPSVDKYNTYSLERVPLYLNLLKEIRLISNGQNTDFERKYHDNISVSLVSECQKESFSVQSIKRLRNYIRSEFRNCPIWLLTKIIIAMDSSGLFSALWLRFHLKLKNVKLSRPLI